MLQIGILRTAQERDLQIVSRQNEKIEANQKNTY